jgi:hypothetical protein
MKTRLALKYNPKPDKLGFVADTQPNTRNPKPDNRNQKNDSPTPKIEMRNRPKAPQPHS